MEDTLLVGDHFLINKFLYGTQIPFTDIRILTIQEPQRGDIIIFEAPPKATAKKRDYLYRIVGLPGDTVEIRQKNVYLNGRKFIIPQEVYKDSRLMLDSPRDNMSLMVIPEKKYFVMGDNRDRTRDSRFWGVVGRNKIKGKAFVKYWSWDRQSSTPRWGRIGRAIE
jgi:signal peptidase I